MTFILCSDHSSLCFGLISARGKRNLAKSGRVNFWKYTPLILRSKQYISTQVFDF